MKLSVRISKPKSPSGQFEHDFSDRPIYADSAKTDLNQIVFGGNSAADVGTRIETQKEEMRNCHNAFIQQKKAGLKDRTFGGWRKNTATHQIAILTFDRTFRAKRDEINRVDLDQCALNFFNDLCEKNGAELTYIIRHEDESTPHYHAMFTNYNSKLHICHRFAKSDLSNLQDMAGDAFVSMNISRGIKRNDRIRATEKLNPQLEGESDQDYRSRIPRISNVYHRYVNELHNDLPREKAALKAENSLLCNENEILCGDVADLELEIDDLREMRSELNFSHDKYTRLINKARNDLAAILGRVPRDEEDVEGLILKIETRISTYKSREAIASASLNDLNVRAVKIENLLTKHNDMLQQKIANIKAIQPDYIQKRIEQLESERVNFAPELARVMVENEDLKHKYALLELELNNIMDHGYDDFSKS